MYYKPDIDLVKKRLMGFWNQELIDRVCISVIAPKIKGTCISMFENPNPKNIDKKQLIDYWTNPDVILKNNIKRIENTYLGGETLPIIFLNFGTSGHCNYYGSKPSYGQNTIWFDPVISSLDQLHESYNKDETLKKHLEVSEFLAKKGKDKFFVSMPDSCGTIDALGHLYGTENLLMDMITDTQGVTNSVDEVNNGWTDSCEQFYKTLYTYTNGSSHAWMHLWAPGRLMQMQCDMSVMFSSEMYKKFVIPELEKQMQWIEYPVYHFDGVEQIQHLPLILNLEKLKAIQWTHVAGQLSAVHYISTLKKIQNAGKSLIIFTPKEDIPELMDNLSHKGLYLHTEASDMQEAKDIINYIKTNTRG